MAVTDTIIDIIRSWYNGTTSINVAVTGLPSAPLSGQKTSTGTAVAIASSQALTQGVIVQALSTNAKSVYVGPSGITTGVATLTVYDSANSTTAGKNILAEMEVDAGMPSCNHEYVNFVSANQGIYVVLTDATNSSSYVIRYAVTG